ncbi:MAG: hypothetical protein WD649_02615 [Thermoleophilaceae bacterium]
MSSPRPRAEPAASRAVDPTTVRLEGPAPEVRISRDMVRRGLWVAPAIIVVSAMIWNSAGAWSSAYALGLVLANFLASAALIALASKISLALLMGATLFGYLIRLGVIFVAVWLVRDAAWISFPALGATIIVSHLGLLVWELKYVAISLAHSGVRSDHPAVPGPDHPPPDN